MFTAQVSHYENLTALYKLISIANQIKQKFPAKSCGASTNFLKLLWGRGCQILIFLFSRSLHFWIFAKTYFEPRLSKVSLLWKLSKQCFVFGHLWLFSQNKQPNDWTKRFQKIPRKINVSLSLAKRKLAEKNEWDLFNQSGEVTHAFINLTNCRKSLFFQLPYLEHDFMITNLVRLNLIFWKYWRRPRNILVLC